MIETDVVPVAAPADGDARPLTRRYGPSWFDRLKVGIEPLPGPAWVFYLGGALLLYGLRTLLQWVAGTDPAGTFDPSLVFTSVWPWYALAAMHYLDRAAGRALDDLRPILSGTAQTQRELRYQLTTMPARPVLATSLGVLVCGAVIFLLLSRDPSLAQQVTHHIVQAYGRGTSPLVLGLTLGAVVIVASVFVYHTLRQLRLIHTITTQHLNVAVFQLTPLYRLSLVTAATAAAWSGGISVALLTFTIPQVLSDPVALVIVLGVIVLAGTTFAWPLLGIHGRLETEKTRLHLDAQERLKTALGELQRRQDSADYDSVGAMNNALDALLKQQTVVDKISTWPWRTGTMEVLASAVVLPLVVWFLTRILAPLIP